jgi:hypothetical protein
MQRRILPHVGIKPLSFDAIESHHINFQKVEWNTFQYVEISAIGWVREVFNTTYMY